MEEIAQAQAAQYVPLPADYLEMRRVHLISTRRKTLALLAAEEANTRFGVMTGEPMGYSMVGNNIQLAPAPDGTYTVEFDYYAKIPALATAVPVNWVLQHYPDLYLYGALMAAAEHIQDDPRVPAWQAKYLAILTNVNSVDRKQRASGSAPYMRAA